ncbi:MAG: hypothetical protein ACREOL_00680 [Candidatus Dormibacteria bacterium]
MATPQQTAELEELTGLLAQAQRGELDLNQLELSQRTARLRQLTDGPAADLDLLWAAESLQTLTRLVELKMGRQMEGDATASAEEAAEEADSDPGQRLAEYRLFKAAAGVLLADASAGPKAFLRVLGLPVEPKSQLELSPQALALALGELLARLPEPTELEFARPRHSVWDKMKALRDLLQIRPRLTFDAVFASAGDRLEAVALFMALLELIWAGEVDCTQASAGSPILVERRRGG